MAIQLKVSNSLDSLVMELATRLERTESVFRPVYIVTQTEGMNTWLKQQLAERLGIAANIRFLKPNDGIYLIFQKLSGVYRQTISANDLTWLLYKVLAENDFVRKYPKIAEYYDPTDPDSAVKRMALAGKIADLMDQYQIYRADMIEEWNRGEGDGGWQKELWQRIKKLAGEEFPDKTRIGNYILKALEDPKKTAVLQEELPHLYFFGLSLITEYHLQIIHSVSAYIDIHFLMQNPAPLDYWYEDKTERLIDFLKRKNIYPKSEQALANPLLVGWGKILQDTFMMLFENEETLNQYEEIGVVELQPDTLLHNIQTSIFHNQKEGVTFTAEQIADESVTISSCYSPIREVEALYNFLVHLVDEKEENLSARDIVVMVSDIDLYASYIKAVFDYAPYKFRYTIADESYAGSDSISQTLIALLSMNEHQFTAEKVVSLLDFPVLRQQFQTPDTESIRKWVDAANIRFGIEGDPDTETDYVSWKYGLKRIMYGLCMRGGTEYDDGENAFYPLDRIEGFEMFQAVRFVYFVEELIDSLENRKKKRDIAGWVEYLEEVIRTFFGASEDHADEDYVLLLNQLEQYNLLQEIFTEEISYEVFLYHFLPTLSKPRRSQAFATGGITFCSLVPMRSIPFKVVALLGMNFDQFPRLDRRLSFDLMQQQKRRGDRNLKENDKHLFLETLLSAGDYFYVSYIGQSVKDNADLPASALVDELLDFIDSGTEGEISAKEVLVQKHPLHGFNPRYNSEDSDLYSYLLTDHQKPKKLIKKKTEASMEYKEIQLRQFISFFKNPVKGFYNRTLEVYYEEEDLSLDETELFALNALENWNLKNSLLKSEEDISDFGLREKKLGRLPLGNMGQVTVQKLSEEIDTTRRIYKEWCEEQKEETVDIELKLGAFFITGRIGGIFDGNLIRYSFSKNEMKYMIEAYLEYLILSAVGFPYRLQYISHVNQKLKSGKVIAREEAQSRLKELVRLYQQGLEEILPFSFGLDIKTDKVKDLDQKKFDKKSRSYFMNTYGNSYKDPYEKKGFEDGFFQKQGAVDRYKEIVQLIVIPTENFYSQD